MRDYVILEIFLRCRVNGMGTKFFWIYNIVNVSKMVGLDVKVIIELLLFVLDTLV